MIKLVIYCHPVHSLALSFFLLCLGKYAEARFFPCLFTLSYKFSVLALRACPIYAKVLWWPVCVLVSWQVIPATPHILFPMPLLSTRQR